MIFHLLTDNPVYIDTFISKADEIGNEENCYILIKQGGIKNIKSKNIYQTSLKGAIEKFNEQKFSRIVIHYLNVPAIEFLNTVDINIPVNWIFWGGDGYKHPGLKKNLYLPMTKKILNVINPRKGLKVLWDKYRSYIFQNKLENSLTKIDFCCTQIKGDYDLIMTAVPNLKMKHKFFAYRGANNKNEVTANKTGEFQKVKLLVGNSANPTNNHIDVLNLLKEFDSKIETITCPLSYAGSKEYIAKVIEFGKNTFGEKFIPLIDFLAFDKYQLLIESINVAVFYHTRQQGYSNTIMMLEQNKKILMNPSSTLYNMYQNFGVANVYSNFEDLFSSSLKTNDNLFNSLGDDVINDWYKNLLNH